MHSSPLGYIIVAERDDGTRSFLARDSSLGANYFTDSIRFAAVFQNAEEARRRVDFSRDTFKQMAAGVSFLQPQREVTITVEALTSSPAVVWKFAVTMVHP